MNEVIRQRLAKVYELVNNGATDGERAAGEAALDRLMKKYNLDKEVLTELTLNQYQLSIPTNLEHWLLVKIMQYFLPHTVANACRIGAKVVLLKSTYFDYIQVDSAYEYFRRHMKNEWNRVCTPEIKRCRKAKTKLAMRKRLEKFFLSTYLIESGLVDSKSIVKINPADISKADYETRMKMQNVEGGKYNKQVAGGLYLENG